jgi:hypothetical protein
MSTMDTAGLRKAIESACGAVRTRITTEHQEHEEKVRKAMEAGDEPPDWDRQKHPSVSSDWWMRWAIDACKDQGLTFWLRDEDVQAALDEDLVGPALQRLLELQEFHHLDGIPLEIGWSPKAAVRKDVVSADNKVGKVKATSKKKRQMWPREAGNAPDFELELSLPFFLLGTEEEIERGLHDLLAHCAFKDDDDGTPTLKKPDISGFASTYGRYGIGTPREAQAVAHLVARPSLTRELNAFGYDPESGQGLLFSPREPRDGNLLDLGGRSRESRQSLGAKALERLGVSVGANGQLTPQTEA